MTSSRAEHGGGVDRRSGVTDASETPYRGAQQSRRTGESASSAPAAMQDSALVESASIGEPAARSVSSETVSRAFSALRDPQGPPDRLDDRAGVAEAFGRTGQEATAGSAQMRPPARRLLGSTATACSGSGPLRLELYPCCVPDVQLHRQFVAPQILLVEWTAADGTAGSFYTRGDALASAQTDAVAVDRNGVPIPGAPAPSVPACAAVDVSVVGFEPAPPPPPPGPAPPLGAPPSGGGGSQQDFAALLWGVPSLSGPVWHAAAALEEPGRPGVCGMPLCSAAYFGGCAAPGAANQSCVMPFAYCNLPGSASPQAAASHDAPSDRLDVILPATLAAVAFAVAAILAALLLRRRRRQRRDLPPAATAARSMSLRSLAGKAAPGGKQASHALASGVLSGGVVSGGFVSSGAVSSGAVGVGAVSDVLKDDGSLPSQQLPSSLENLAAYGIFVEAASTSTRGVGGVAVVGRGVDAGLTVHPHVPITIDEMAAPGARQPMLTFELQGAQRRGALPSAARPPARRSSDDALTSDEYVSLWARLAGARRHQRAPTGRVVATRNACYVSSTPSPSLWQTPPQSGEGARASSAKAPSETRSVNLSIGELDSLVSAGSGRFNWCSLDTETKSFNEISLLRSLRAVQQGGGLLPSSQDGAWTQAELQEQLQELRGRQGLLAGRYKLTGEFACGGQGLVAFACTPLSDSDQQGPQQEVAIKFPLNRQAFVNEVRVSSHPVYKAHVPELVEVRASTVGLQAPNHKQLPAFLVLPRGEPLDEFVQKHRPGPLQCVLVLVLLAEKLAALHENGLTHRDVKPANSIWLPLQHTWTLIDYGSAAAVDSESPIALTPRYGAPELAVGVSERRETMGVTAAVDVWSLGVMSYELLAAGDAFSSMPANDYWMRLLGGGPLPWEQSERPEAMKVGDSFVRVIKQMLSRDPRERPSMREVVRGWKQAINMPE